MNILRSANWLLFIVLCIIWGSSFILMKEGLKSLSAYQVASLRMLTAGLVLFPVAIRQWPKYRLQVHGRMLLSGIMGSFIPAYLFCIAETRIDSSLAGFLNAFTPILTILFGIWWFQRKFEPRGWTGVSIGLVGMTMLFLGRNNTGSNDFGFTSLVLIATVLYALNLNFVGKYLKEALSLDIVSIAFLYLSVPALVVLYYTGFFDLELLSRAVIWSTSASTVLGVLGTALGTIFYYKLLKESGPLFASLVTYGIPFVALAWGLIAGETVTTGELIGLVVILVGVYLANK